VAESDTSLPLIGDREREMASRTDILKRYGITDRTELRVWTFKEGPLPVVAVDGIGDHGIDDPVVALSPERAIELSIEFRQIGEETLAVYISTAATRAQKANALLLAA
jgi:hypothetical protein